MSPNSTALTPSMTFTSDELAAFERDGYAIVRNLASKPIRERMEQVVFDNISRHVGPLEYEADLNYPGAPTSREEAGGRTIRRLKQAHSRDFVFTEWMQYPALTSRLRQLLGEQIVCPLAHHNCIMTKEPEFSSDTGWHQDIRYWSFAAPDLVSVWLALGKESGENGCLQLIPGSHRDEFLANQFDSELFFRNDLPENQAVLSKAIRAELEPGDVLFFHCRTLHSATRNFSEQTKYSVVTTYRGVHNPPTPGERSAALPEMLIH